MTQMVWAVRHAMAERERRRFPRVPSRCLQAWQTRWGNWTSLFFYHWISITIPHVLLSKLTVPAKQRTYSLLDFSGGHFHAIGPVLWCGFQTRMSRPRNLETIHETIRQNHSQSIAGLCRYSQKGVSSVDQRWTYCKWTWIMNHISITD